MNFITKAIGILTILVTLFLIFSCKKKPTPPIIITTSMTGITQTSASSGGNITSDGGSDITARGVCWATTTKPTVANSKTTDGVGTGDFPSYITGLTASTEYFVSAYATNNAGTSYGNEETFTTAGGQIIADHTIVSDYDKIPQYYIDLVKKMWLNVPGESHSYAYLNGPEMVMGLDPKYAVVKKISGTREAYTTEHLRVSNVQYNTYYLSSGGWVYGAVGEQDWWTNSTGKAIVKAHITYCNTHSLTISAFGFGWCYDAYADGSSAGTDPVYGCHWWGWSEGSPSGNDPWGLDAEDYLVTGNSVCLDTYLAATQEYIDYCTANGYATKVFFSTGPVDKGTTARPDEEYYQNYLKQERIRDYVAANSTRILFDYADILCYDDAGIMSTKTWNGHTFPAIVPTYDVDHHIFHFQQI